MRMVSDMKACSKYFLLSPKTLHKLASIKSYTLMFPKLFFWPIFPDAVYNEFSFPIDYWPLLQCIERVWQCDFHRPMFYSHTQSANNCKYWVGFVEHGIMVLRSTGWECFKLVELNCLLGMWQLPGILPDSNLSSDSQTSMSRIEFLPRPSRTK